MEIVIYIVFIFFLNIIIKKKKLILSNTGFKHQSYTNIPTPLTGGIFILLPTFYLFLPTYYLFVCTFSLLFFLGLLSDLNIFESAKKRFLIQSIIILLFTFISELEVTPTKILFFDNLITNTYWSFLFTTFCLMILINGSNFIDGLNGLLLGYFFLVILILFKLDLIYSLYFLEKNFFYFCLAFLFVLILNVNNKLFLGDNGAYSLSFLIGFLLIEIYNSNQFISPYFIILLLWYPCFENLFSIIRKIIKGKNPLEPDTEHLHQKLFIYFKSKLKINNLKSNVLTSSLIIFFNLLIFYFASMAISHTIYQLCLIAISITIYLVSYIVIHKILIKNYPKNF